MAELIAAELIAVDWGTTALRAGLIAPDGSVLDERRSDQGAARLFGGDIATPLRSLIGDWLGGRDLPIYACGMVGARGGWAEVPYVACPADLDGLAAGVVRVPFAADQEVVLVPGVKDLGDPALGDVMRGEETQILGLPGPSRPGLVVLPRTHSKWVRVGAGGILGFRTFLTGDLFAALRRATVLKATTTAEPGLGAAFDRGLAEGLAGPHLLARLFALRARPLLGLMPESDASSHLSGLLIGTEVREAAALFEAASRPIVLVGEGQLVEAYRRALGEADFAVDTAPAHAAYLGLLKLHRRLCGEDPA